ncbi:hypothetical protein EDB89DRAFT_1968185 [Lactarius sanguifluus]|nr:hypothetical protein EDB89DRAFT_1968185 [Lactarius sanguifluus]
MLVVSLVLITFECCYGVSPQVVTNPLLSPVLGPLSSETLTEGAETTAPIPRALTVPQSPPESVLSSPSVFPSGTSLQSAINEHSSPHISSISCVFWAPLFRGHIRGFVWKHSSLYFGWTTVPAAPDVVCNSLFLEPSTR